MNARALKVLEFNKIIASIEQMTVSELGAKKVRAIKPIQDINEIQQMLAETKEIMDIIINYDEIPFGPIHAVKTYLKKAKVGSYLSIKEILNISDTLRTARRIKKSITAIDDFDQRFPNIANLVNGISTYKKLEDKINHIILNEDEIADDASPKLAQIRENIKRTNNSVRGKLDSIINNPSLSKYLQDNIVTIRNNRFVVPVKSSYKNKIDGIVHDKSASGVTLYIEPNVVVQLNNKLKELKMEESEEIERILFELTQDINNISQELIVNEDLLTDLDYINAKAEYALKYDCIVPRLNQEKTFRMKNARHPLLDQTEVVPIDIWLGKDFKSLVITGPNTGGKTVTLKTVGLLSLMGMAGILIPADLGTEICIFDEVFADIGDEQSIEQSLSTFSSHMTNIVDTLENVTENSLVLFDELGAGTDPTEGAALAISILDYLFKRDVLTIATTHYNELKEFALVEEGIENANVEFDVETLSPTYKLSIGIPGRSNAFEISQKLGLNHEVINEARALVKKENIQFEEIISSIEEDKKITEEEKDEAINLRLEVERLKNELETERNKLAERKERIIREAKLEAKSILKEAKNQSNEIIRKLRDYEKDHDFDNKAIEHMRQELNEDIKKHNVEELVVDEAFEAPNQLKEGDKVKIMTLGQEGEVIDIDGESVTVQAGFMKVNVSMDDLKLIDSGKVVNPQEKSQSKSYGMKSKNIKPEIDIRGMNVDEAVLKLDKYLDEVYLSSISEVTIIHGKGTGALRAGVREFLDTHHYVESYREGQRAEGGSGVTVVKLV